MYLIFNIKKNNHNTSTINRKPRKNTRKAIKTEKQIAISELKLKNKENKKKQEWINKGIKKREEETEMREEKDIKKKKRKNKIE